MSLDRKINNLETYLQFGGFGFLRKDVDRDLRGGAFKSFKTPACDAKYGRGGVNKSTCISLSSCLYRKKKGRQTEGGMSIDDQYSRASEDAVRIMEHPELCLGTKGGKVKAQCLYQEEFGDPCPPSVGRRARNLRGGFKTQADLDFLFDPGFSACDDKYGRAKGGMGERVDKATCVSLLGCLYRKGKARHKAAGMSIDDQYFRAARNAVKIMRNPRLCPGTKDGKVKAQCLYQEEYGELCPQSGGRRARNFHGGGFGAFKTPACDDKYGQGGVNKATCASLSGCLYRKGKARHKAAGMSIDDQYSRAARDAVRIMRNPELCPGTKGGKVKAQCLYQEEYGEPCPQSGGRRARNFRGGGLRSF